MPLNHSFSIAKAPIILRGCLKLILVFDVPKAETVGFFMQGQNFKQMQLY